MAKTIKLIIVSSKALPQIEHPSIYHKGWHDLLHRRQKDKVSALNVWTPTEHSLLIHVCAIAFTCISNEPRVLCLVARAGEVVAVLPAIRRSLLLVYILIPASLAYAGVLC